MREIGAATKSELKKGLTQAVAKPQITVLMAVYNAEKCLTDTIESILNQIFKDFEFLIINDGSTDKTVDIIKSYNDKRIYLYNNETNIGQTKSLNVGLKLAKGKYIARIDADDYSMPDRLEKQYRFIQEHPEYSVVGTNCLVIDDYNRKEMIVRKSDRYEDIVLQMFSNSPVNHISVLMKKADIENVGGYASKKKICADFDLWSKLVRNGYKLTNLSEVLSVFRCSTESYSNRNRKERVNERAEIIYENIKAFSHFTVDRVAAKEISYIFGEEFAKMSDERILTAEGIYKNVIMQLKPELGVIIDRKKRRRDLEKNYWRIAYKYILDNRGGKARKTIKKCIRNHGISLYSILLYALSCQNVGSIRKINYFRSKTDSVVGSITQRLRRDFSASN